MAEPNAKAINLRVRPLQSVDLCFPVDGIIADQPDVHLLGKPVTAFDLPTLYGKLGGPAVVPDKGRLKYDSAAIRGEVGGGLLFGLRAEAVKAALDKAIAQRENTFFQKFANQTDIIQKMRDYFKYTGSGDQTSKLGRLETLKSLSDSLFTSLDVAYATDSTDRRNDGLEFPATTKTTDDTKGVIRMTDTSTENSSPRIKTTTTPGTSPTQPTTQTQEPDTTPSDNIVTKTKTKSRGYDYRNPYLENQAQLHRAQVSLIDERFAQFMFTQNLPHLETVFKNELQSMDLDVRRLQVAYLDTLLVSPIDGRVTGVFQGKGACIRAGQPIARVENDEEVFLVGTIKHRGLIRVGSTVTVSTEEFDSPTPLSTTGFVVSVRGHDSEDEQWDVLVLCPNRQAGNPIFPINYNFDFDDTDVTIS
jgi:hypothetical protein